MEDVLDDSGLRMRGYAPGDEARIGALFERTYGRRETDAHWRWKLRSRPSPAENVFLALDGDRAVFHYGGVPRRLRIRGRELDAMLSVDAMTDPDFRKRGLLTEVGRHAYDTWRAAGVALTYGLPNRQWGSRTGALGWRTLFPLRWRLLPLRPEAMLGRRLGWPALSHLDVLGRLTSRSLLRTRGGAALAIRAVTQAGAELDRLWERSAPLLEVSPVRDASWVSWRYLAEESRYDVLIAERGGEPAGYAAFRVAEGAHGPIGVVAEIFATEDEEAAWELLAESVRRLRAGGADRAVALAVPGTSEDRLFARAGFVRRRRRFDVAIVPLQDGLPMDALSDPARFSMSGGDFDVV
jgi:hypothetical protein